MRDPRDDTRRNRKLLGGFPGNYKPKQQEVEAAFKFKPKEPKAGVVMAGPGYKAAGPHFAFHFQNRAAVDDVHARLKAEGVHVGAVHDHRDGTASFYLKDPEGNWLEMLYEPPGGIPSNCP